MTRLIPLHQFMPYGAPDLIADESRRMARALLTSALGAVAVYGALATAFHLLPARQIEIPLRPAITLCCDPEAPMDIPAVTPPPAGRVSPPASPAAGVVVPVSDDAAAPAPIADSWSGSQASSAPAGEFGGDVAAAAGPGADVEPDPLAFQLVDELPVLITSVKPAYPELARESRTEGRVIVRALVGVDGRVSKAFVMPASSIPLLDQSAIDAARRSVFKPAYVSNHPVAVWVTMPFLFRLD